MDDGEKLFSQDVQRPPVEYYRNYLFKPKPGSDVLMIAFSGIHRGFGLPTLEFIKSTAELPINKLYLKDAYCSWYFNGIPEVGNNIDEIVSFIKRHFSTIKKSFTIGHSGGGFAAILFGSLLRVNEVYAFGPQTFLSNSLRKVYSENRWAEHAVKLKHSVSPYLDVNKVICQDVEYYIYYGSGSKGDKRHLKHLQKSDNIHITIFDGAPHDIVKYLKSTGQLNKILLTTYYRLAKIPNEGNNNTTE